MIARPPKIQERTMITSYSHWMAIILFALMLGGMAFSSRTAFSDSTLPASGQGLAVTNIHYHLNAADPQRLDAVSFDLPSAAADEQPIAVKIDLISGNASWSFCGAGDGPRTCIIPDGPLVADVERLEVMVMP
jgi:hypothetical protein